MGYIEEPTQWCFIRSREQSYVVERRWQRDGGGQLLLGSTRSNLGVNVACDLCDYVEVIDEKTSDKIH